MRKVFICGSDEESFILSFRDALNHSITGSPNQGFVFLAAFFSQATGAAVWIWHCPRMLLPPCFTLPDPGTSGPDVVVT